MLHGISLRRIFFGSIGSFGESLRIAFGCALATTMVGLGCARVSWSLGVSTHDQVWVASVAAGIAGTLLQGTGKYAAPTLPSVVFGLATATVCAIVFLFEVERPLVAQYPAILYLFIASMFVILRMTALNPTYWRSDMPS
jgi:uncharacterized membrane protein YjjP (DUF1212 family)